MAKNITSVKWIAEELPPGLSINQSTGKISGTPSSEVLAGDEFKPRIIVQTNYGSDAKYMDIKFVETYTKMSLIEPLVDENVYTAGVYNIYDIPKYFDTAPDGSGGANKYYNLINNSSDIAKPKEGIDENYGNFQWYISNSLGEGLYCSYNGKTKEVELCAKYETITTAPSTFYLYLINTAIHAYDYIRFAYGPDSAYPHRPYLAVTNEVPLIATAPEAAKNAIFK